MCLSVFLRSLVLACLRIFACVCVCLRLFMCSHVFEYFYVRLGVFMLAVCLHVCVCVYLCD